jgi:hypothetical protein
MDTNINIQDKYYNKYIKYKIKYLELKEQRGGEDYTRDDNNEGCFLPIKNIYFLFKEILDIFIPEDIPEDIPQNKPKNKPKKRSSWYSLSSWFRNNPSKTIIEIPIIEKKIIKKPIIEVEEEIINILKSIKEDFVKSYSIYEDFFNYITGGIYKKNIEFYCEEYVKDMQQNMENKKNDIINSILQIKNNHEEFGKIIINKLNEYNIDLLIPDINYKENVFDNLKYIIEYYFYKINLGIEKSYPKLLKIKHQFYRDMEPPITYKISKYCFRKPEDSPIPPIPPPRNLNYTLDKDPLPQLHNQYYTFAKNPTPPTPPPRNPKYTLDKDPTPPPRNLYNTLDKDPTPPPRNPKYTLDKDPTPPPRNLYNTFTKDPTPPTPPPRKLK